MTANRKVRITKQEMSHTSSYQRCIQKIA